MTSRIWVQDTFIGRIEKILIDDGVYPVTGDGCSIQHVATYDLKFVVGSLSPRVRVLQQYFKVDLVLAENTLENLQMAWNLPGSIDSAGTIQTMYLGQLQSPAVHTLQINGWIFGGNNAYRQRRWYFDQVCFFNPAPQQMTPNNLVNITCSFYAYGNSDATAGQEFGHVIVDLPTGYSPSTSALLLESGSFIETENGWFALVE